MFAAGDLALKAVPSEKMISLMYSTGFRLTGSHQAAILLVKKALGKYEGKSSPAPAEAVKSLCRAFIMESADWVLAGGDDVNPVQKELLKLEPRERTAVILRDHLGFSYAEIAGVAMAGENDVAATIAAARYKLKNRLTEKAASLNDD